MRAVEGVTASSSPLPPPPPPPPFSSPPPPPSFSFASAELRRLQAEAEWADTMRRRARKAADDWQRRQRQKRGGYSLWTEHRDSQREERERARETAERRTEEEREGTADGSAFYGWSQFGEAPSASALGALSVPPSVFSAGAELGLSPPPLPPPPQSPATALWRAWHAEAIKAAFKRCALRSHPDMPTGDARTFQRVAAAYDLLMHSREKWKTQRRTL